MSRRTVLIEAPANLGLRPPAPGAVPGCGKLPGARRDQELSRALDAVDSAEPGGLFPGELRALVAPLVASPRCAGLQLTVYDPDRDATEMPGARLLTELLTRVLR
ncbi:hypothetical protein [Streptomyces reniochalinae]|uniref:Arginase family protein n=1 Tax=Streptomyces reniochalinae TaxID=2250578 RepID=A0A367ED68_9ACTN|nr:hypothetical protein [Streptomyces reniochalinae]RCG16016.1 hypothetical protein DQ392_23580 [Streptomyces reniochalinae]